MPGPLAQFSLWRMMVAVGLVALLIPFPTAVLVYTVVWSAGLTLLFAPVALVWNGQPRGRAGVIISLYAAGWLGLFFLLSPVGSWPGQVWLLAVDLGLLAAILTGPGLVARRLRRGEPVPGGEILFWWLSGVWGVRFDAWRQGEMTAFVNAETARLSLVLAVLLALYGPRPASGRRAIGHYLGWILLEGTAIVWGLDAAWPDWLLWFLA